VAEEEKQEILRVEITRASTLFLEIPIKELEEVNGGPIVTEDQRGDIGLLYDLALRYAVRKHIQYRRKPDSIRAEWDT
jgi:hypothetical protein